MPERTPAPVNRRWALLLVSIAGLFLEMLMIRWIGTEIRIFAYLQNTILVVCFLGLGLGCFTSRRAIDLRRSLIPLALLVSLMAIPVTRDGLGRISTMLSATGDLNIWDSAVAVAPWTAAAYVVLGLGATFGVLLLIVDVFVPIGRLLGRLMDADPEPITAYSINIAGSLLGTWLFVLLSYFFQPPWVWLLVLAALLVPLIARTTHHRRASLVLLAAVVLLGWFAGLESGSIRTVWSPYQKLVLEKTAPESHDIGDYVVTVNNTGYQAMTDLSEARTSAEPERFPPVLRGLSQYDIPLLLHPHPRSYLVVGAGTGNNAAAAVRHGVPDVTAVEIDPAIIAIGRAYHPERPYASSAVRLVNDDARSFLATTHGKFDLISFGLLDSHTTTAMTNARLDHYVYTRESIARARSLLAPGGVMVLSFEAQKPFIADRMAGVLRDVFGESPIAFLVPPSAYGWGGVIFVAGDLSVARQQIAANPRLAGFIEASQRMFPLDMTYQTRLTTDDWPYIYLRSARIPLLYFLLGILIAVLFVRSYRRWHATGVVTRWDRAHWHFAFLGAAFLLLEVQNISKASVALGNTWQVNAVIVSGVLLMALLANLIAHRYPRLPLPPVYALLIGTAAGLYFVDIARFASLPYATKALLVGGLTTLPMLFSGIVFVRSFAAAARKDEALGANLIGALAGGLLQSLTFVTGIKALLLVVAGLYALSLLTSFQATTRPAAEAARTREVWA